MTIPATKEYRLPAPFGSIVFAATGTLYDELFAVRPSLMQVESPDPAPEAICRWINLVDNILVQFCVPSQKDYAELFDLPAMRALSPFARSVLDAVTRIPTESLTTYTEVAETIGQPSAVRAVAGALAANPFPILIPCHRVVSVEMMHKIDITNLSTLSGAAYLGQSDLAGIAAWLRMHDQTYL